MMRNSKRHLIPHKAACFDRAVPLAQFSGLGVQCALGIADALDNGHHKGAGNGTSQPQKE